jgi:hypothetical protein
MTASERRRRGLQAGFQRALTGFFFDRLRLRRASDARIRSGIIRLVNVLMFALFFTRPAWASVGTEGASFLNIPVGGRPAALGSGYTAMAKDAYAPVWNPAGLGFLEDTQIGAQHLSYLESIHYEFLSLVHPFREGRALGFSVQYLGSGDIPSTNDAGDSIGDFSTYYAAYSLAYGHRLTERLSLGGTAKWINAKISDLSANAFGFDFGTFFQASKRLALAGTLTNMGTKLKFINTGDPLPLALRLAATFQILPQAGLNTEFVYRKNGLASGHFGGEWRPVEPIALRVGYRTDTLKGLSPLAGLTTGIGVKVMGQEFSYAWLPYGDLGNTQYFSLVLRFGGAPEAKRNLIHFQTIKKHEMVRKEDRMPEYQEISQLLEDTAKPKPDHLVMERIEREMMDRVAKGDKKRAKAAKRRKNANSELVEKRLLEDLLNQSASESHARRGSKRQSANQ